MSISHELSGEIAAALFAAKQRPPGELKDLKDMLFEIHSTLEQLTQKQQAVQERTLSGSESGSENNHTNTASAAST